MPAGVQRLVARLGDVPIGVFTAGWSLVSWNALWAALHGDPALVPPGDRNPARMMFGPLGAALRPVRSERGPEAFAAAIVADLKDAAARYPADPGLAALVRDLRANSADFAGLWAAPTPPTPHASERKTITHPDVGDITLDCDVLLVPGADLRVVTYTAAAGSPDAGALDLLRVTGGHPATAR